MGGRAGEVLEQVAERVRLDDPQVHGDSVVGGDPGPGPPGRARLGRELVLGQRHRERLGVAGGRDQIDVLAGLGASAGRPRDLDRVGGRMRAQGARELLGDRQHLGEQQALRRPLLAELRQRREHVLLRLRPESLEAANLLALRGLAQVVEAGDAELVVELAHGLRAEAGDPGHLDQRGRELRLQLRRGGDLAGLGEGDDLLLERRPDARQLGRAPGERQLLDRDRALANHPRRLLVGEHPVADRAVELVQGGELGHRLGDLGVSHRHRPDSSEAQASI